jgi:hypothetical protein
LSLEKFHADELAVLINDPAKTRGLTVLAVNGDRVSGVQRGGDGTVRQLDMFRVVDGEIVQDSTIAGRKRMFMGPVMMNRRNKNMTFHCGVEHKEEWDERFLLGGDEGHHKDHHQHHQHHDHHHYNSIRHLQNLFPDNLNNPAYKKTNNEQETPLPNTRFQINLILDIDTEFIQKQGGSLLAIEYINLLFTIANTVFEKEVGVRFHIVHVQEVSYFQSATNLRDGLKLMRERYDRDFPDNVQLRHALLGQYIGGGIAFIDAVCDGRYGVGLSSGLEGRVESLDENAVYDLFIMMHELGHSLGSGECYRVV